MFCVFLNKKCRYVLKNFKVFKFYNENLVFILFIINLFVVCIIIIYFEYYI